MKENTNTIHSFEVRLPGRENMPPLHISAKDALTVMLVQYTGRKRTTKDAKAGLMEMLGDAERPGVIVQMTFEVTETPAGPQILTTYTGTAASQADADKQRQQFNTYLADEGIQALVLNLVLRGPLLLSKILSNELAKPEKTHKQSRTLMRDIAKSVGRDKKQLSLFKMPLNEAVQELERQIADSPTGRPQKDVMSQKAAQLALKLMQEYQTAPKDENDFAIIKDVGRLADDIGTDNTYLKYLLLYLSGYQYTHTQMFDDKIGVKMAQYFDIWLMYPLKRKAYIPDIYKDAAGTMNLIANERIDEVRVKPTAEFVNDVLNKKKSLGHIRVTNGIHALLNGLTVMAFKLAAFSGAQRPQYAIGEDKLLDHLELKSQAKAQGMPRVRRQLLDAMQELKVKGYFKEYLAEERPDGWMYGWQYTDKYIKHQDKYLNPAPVEYIDYKDTTIPLEKRRERFVEFVRSKRKMTLEKAQAKAEKAIPE